MFQGRSFLLVFCSLFCLLFSIVPAKAQEDARTLLLSMAKKIAETPCFRVSLRIGYDVLQDNGQKIEFGEKRKILVQRPSSLRVEVLQSDGDKAGLVYDGEFLYQYDLSRNIYTKLKIPGDIDHLVQYAREMLDIRIPLALLLTTHFHKDLREMTQEVFYVERDVLTEVPTHHIAGRTDKVDYEVWIGDDDLPRRIIITYRLVYGEPQFWANFEGWDLSPSIPSDAFRFQPSKGMEEVPFVLPVKKTKKPGQK